MYADDTTLTSNLEKIGKITDVLSLEHETGHFQNLLLATNEKLLLMSQNNSLGHFLNLQKLYQGQI